MKILALILAVLPLVVVPARAQQSAGGDAKSKIYNHITEEGTPFDKVVRETFAKKFDLVDLHDSDGYKRPNLIAGEIPKTAESEFGAKLKGNVLIVFIITSDGRATDEVILKSEDIRLNKTVLKAMRQWRFEPATLKGLAISTTAVQVIEIKKP